VTLGRAFGNLFNKTRLPLRVWYLIVFEFWLNGKNSKDATLYLRALSYKIGKDKCQRIYTHLREDICFY
jgi:hypothetical protein